MKTFKYNHSVFAWIVLGVVLIASLVGLVLSIISAINFDGRTSALVLNILLCFINALLFAFTLSIILCSKYSIEQTGVRLRFGLFSSFTSAEEIACLIHVVREKKLVAKFCDEKFSRVVIKPELFDDFYSSLLKTNDQIEFLIDYTQENA